MKILIIHASAGAGHKMAAKAIHDELSRESEHQVEIVDALDYANPLFRHTYSGSYELLITKCPQVWGLFFKLVDVPWLQPLIRFMRRGYNAINTPRLHRHLVEGAYDWVISTHFLPIEVVSALKRSDRISSKMMACVTDYDVHRIWLGSGVDCYSVATEWTKNKMLRLGVCADRIRVTGIPCHKKFAQPHDVPKIRAGLNLQGGEFTVLIATGSFGIGPIEEIIDALPDFQIIVVCGHNKHLFERLKHKNAPHVKVLGLVDNMHELMAAADMMVSKPGGLSITEALVSHLPLIFFNAIPGQETHNIQVLAEHGIGISHCTIAGIAAKLMEVRASVEIYEDMCERTRVLAKPGAVDEYNHEFKGFRMSRICKFILIWLLTAGVLGSPVPVAAYFFTEEDSEPETYQNEDFILLEEEPGMDQFYALVLRDGYIKYVRYNAYFNQVFSITNFFEFGDAIPQLSTIDALGRRFFFTTNDGLKSTLYVVGLDTGENHSHIYVRVSHCHDGIRSRDRKDLRDCPKSA